MTTYHKFCMTMVSVKYLKIMSTSFSCRFNRLTDDPMTHHDAHHSINHSIILKKY